MLRAFAVDQGDLHHIAFGHRKRRVDDAVEIAAAAHINQPPIGDCRLQGEFDVGLIQIEITQFEGCRRGLDDSLQHLQSGQLLQKGNDRVTVGCETKTGEKHSAAGQHFPGIGQEGIKGSGIPNQPGLLHRGGIEIAIGRRRRGSENARQ